VLAGYLAASCGRYDMITWADSSYRILTAVEESGGRVSISGFEHAVKTAGPKVYVANHMSMLETMLLPVIVLTAGEFTVVVKESLARYPFFGKILRSVKAISVGRRNPRQDFRNVLKSGEEFLRQGASVLVFPQATRHVDFDPSDFNSLGVKLAGRAGVPAVPIALKTDFMRIGRIFRDIGCLDRSKTVYFKFGNPVTVTGNTKDAHREVVRFIAESLEEWRGVETVEKLRFT